VALGRRERTAGDDPLRDLDTGRPGKAKRDRSVNLPEAKAQRLAPLERPVRRDRILAPSALHLALAKEPQHPLGDRWAVARAPKGALGRGETPIGTCELALLDQQHVAREPARAGAVIQHALRPPENVARGVAVAQALRGDLATQRVVDEVLGAGSGEHFSGKAHLPDPVVRVAAQRRDSAELEVPPGAPDRPREGVEAIGQARGLRMRAIDLAGPPQRQ